MLIRIRSAWCGIAPGQADQLKRRRVDQGANGSSRSLAGCKPTQAARPHKPSPCCRGWSPKADLIVTNTTLPVVCRWTLPRRRVPTALSIHSVDRAIPPTYPYLAPGYNTHLLIASPCRFWRPFPIGCCRSPTGATGSCRTLPRT
jgi:hypothetical protein